MVSAWLPIALLFAQSGEKPAEYSAQGPLLVCDGDVGIDIGADETVHAIGTSFRVTGKDDALGVMRASLSEDVLAHREAVWLDTSTLAYRYTGLLPEDAKSVAAYHSDAGAIRYAMSAEPSRARRDGRFRPMLILASRRFDGSQADKAILSRLRTGMLTDPACIRPLEMVSGKIPADDPPEQIAYNEVGPHGIGRTYWYLWASGQGRYERGGGTDEVEIKRDLNVGPAGFREIRQILRSLETRRTIHCEISTTDQRMGMLTFARGTQHITVHVDFGCGPAPGEDALDLLNAANQIVLGWAGKHRALDGPEASRNCGACAPLPRN